MTQVQDTIKRSVTNLTNSTPFSDWFEQQIVTDRDLVVLNSSFIYRNPEIKTLKNAQYLGLKIRERRPNMGTIFIAEPGEINSEFKLLSAKSGNSP